MNAQATEGPQDKGGAQLSEREFGILDKDSSDATTESGCDPSAPAPPRTSARVSRRELREGNIPRVAGSAVWTCGREGKLSSSPETWGTVEQGAQRGTSTMWLEQFFFGRLMWRKCGMFVEKKFGKPPAESSTLPPEKNTGDRQRKISELSTLAGGKIPGRVDCVADVSVCFILSLAASSCGVQAKSHQTWRGKLAFAPRQLTYDSKISGIVVNTIARLATPDTTVMFDHHVAGTLAPVKGGTQGFLETSILVRGEITTRSSDASVVVSVIRRHGQKIPTVSLWSAEQQARGPGRQSPVVEFHRWLFHPLQNLEADNVALPLHHHLLPLLKDKVIGAFEDTHVESHSKSHDGGDLRCEAGRIFCRYPSFGVVILERWWLGTLVPPRGIVLLWEPREFHASVADFASQSRT
ncbi:hypothetical protein EDD15DRAFT_2522445 [Pisolithus albus]|nr:hypothetical protein EDD15DRAFT_2522445 [Pisolithus albus]